MIRRIKHLVIDRQKYQACLHQSDNYRIYAEDWYLDCNTNFQWDCFIYGDYEMVMPLPYTIKLGFKIIYQPTFNQQLGVFYRNSQDVNILKEFSKQFRKLLLLNYQFNSDQWILDSNLLFKKKNFLLELNSPYTEILNNYRKDRRKDIRRIEALKPVVSKTLNLDCFLQELKLKYPNLVKFYNNPGFSSLIENIISRNLYTYYELLDQGKVIACIFVVHSRNRRILLLSSRSQENQYKGAFAFLVDYFIKENSEKNLLLDFEGSMISTIADFNSSFGAQIEEYAIINNSKIEAIKGYFVNQLL